MTAQGQSETQPNEAAENDAILTRLCTDLAWKIVGGPERISAADTAAAIKRLVEQWSDGQREVDALIAEELREPVVAMVIRGQFPSHTTTEEGE
jgi:hypothetical protein